MLTLLLEDGQLGNNESGNGNTAIGEDALKTNTTGDNNTALGNNADVASNNLSNATAVGANAVVSQSNSLVLGNNVNVGIGNLLTNSKFEYCRFYFRKCSDITKF